MRSKDIMVVTCILWSEMSQDGDDTNPPDRGNPDLLRMRLFLFDLGLCPCVLFVLKAPLSFRFIAN